MSIPTAYSRKPRLMHGFTLIELSVVMIIAGLLLGATVTGLTTYIQASKVKQATEELEIAKQALIGYVMRLGYLPCPDTDGFPPAAGVPDGIGNGSGTAAGCSADPVTLGYLPWVDLGITATDPWDTPYYYAVTDEFANLAVGATVTFNLTDIGTITINDSNAIPPPPINVVAQDIPAVIFSIGPNGNLTLAAASVHEDQNIDNAGANNGIFVERPYTAPDAAAPEFDDILTWISPNLLRLKMVEAGRLPE